MGMLVVALGGVIALAGLICTLIILIEAWQDEAWKAILGFLLPIYLLYYAFAEFEHDKKWPIIAGSLFGTGLGGVVMGAGLSMMG